MQQPHATSQPGEYDASAIARKLVDVAVDKKAGDVALIEIGNLTTLADFFILATGTSERQIGAIRNALEESMDESGIRLFNREGMPGDGWVLLDYGQVIVHIFAPEQRAYYDLERRWKEAPTLLKVQ